VIGGIAQAHSVAAMLLTVALAFACTDSSPGGPENPGKRSMNVASETSACVGRFRFTVPPPLVVSGRSQSIYRVDVRTAATTQALPAARQWEERLQHIRQRATQLGLEGSGVRVFELQPGVRAVWFAREPGDGAPLTLEAMQPQEGGHALWLAREVLANAQAVTEGMYRRIIDGYRTQGTRGFCVGHGMLVTETSRYELALLSLSDPARPGFTIALSTETTDRPDTRNALEDVEEERRLLAESGVELVMMRNAERTVARLPGVEARVRIQARGEPPVVRMSWRFAGVAGSAVAPQFTILASAGQPDQAALESAWEILLRSLEPLALPN